MRGIGRGPKKVLMQHDLTFCVRFMTIRVGRYRAEWPNTAVPAADPVNNSRRVTDFTAAIILLVLVTHVTRLLTGSALGQTTAKLCSSKKLLQQALPSDA